MLPTPRVIFGYHGCDESVLKMVLNGGFLKPSINDYDWLGNGIYFWEGSAARANRWAKEMAATPASRVKKPAVIGAVINLGHCLDLADPDGGQLVSLAYHDFLKRCSNNGLILPRNRGEESKARFLDCAVMNHLHHLSEEAGLPPFDSVRGFFNEGQPVYPTAGLRTLDHVQVCIGNPASITGFFRPNTL